VRGETNRRCVHSGGKFEPERALIISCEESSIGKGKKGGQLGWSKVERGGHKVGRTFCRWGGEPCQGAEKAKYLGEKIGQKESVRKGRLRQKNRRKKKGREVMCSLQRVSRGRGLKRKKRRARNQTSHTEKEEKDEPHESRKNVKRKLFRKSESSRRHRTTQAKLNKTTQVGSRYSYRVVGGFGMRYGQSPQKGPVTEGRE